MYIENDKYNKDNVCYNVKGVNSLINTYKLNEVLKGIY